AWSSTTTEDPQRIWCLRPKTGERRALVGKLTLLRRKLYLKAKRAVCSCMLKVKHSGAPDAGNLHVRCDEGKGARPRASFLLYRDIFLFQLQLRLDFLPQCGPCIHPTAGVRMLIEHPPLGIRVAFEVRCRGFERHDLIAASREV